MTGRPEDIGERLENVRQIEDVVVALRAMAAAHARDARNHIAAIRQHAATVQRAMASAIVAAVPPEPAPTSEEGHLMIVVGAAQGFAGLYNEHVVTSALEHAGQDEAPQFLLVGQRCAAEFDRRGIAPVWSANMVVRAAEVPGLASRIADTLYERIGRRAVERVSLIHGSSDKGPLEVTFHHLLPFDFSRIGGPVDSSEPLMTLPPERLLERLVEEYVFADICEALMQSFAAENDARMQAMTRARSNVDDMAEDLERAYRIARQEKTTMEIFELTVGSHRPV